MSFLSVVVLVGLDELVAVAEELEQPYLRACAVRAKAIVLADHKHDLMRAVGLAKEELDRIGDEPRGRFLLVDCIARQYLFAEHNREAREWFAKALAITCDGLDQQRAVTMAHASRAFGEVDAATAVGHAEAAVHLAAKVPHVTEEYTVSLLGELGIARWLAGDLKGCYETMDRAVEILLSVRERGELWRGLFMCLGHTCGYLGSIALFGQPPASGRDGGPWLAPMRGFFLRDHSAKATLYREDQTPSIFVQLVQIAEGVGNDTMADKWAARGLAVAKTGHSPVLLSVFANLTLAHLITVGDYSAALDVGRQSARCTVALSLLGAPTEGQVWQDMKIEEIFAQHVGDHEADAERTSATMVLLPIMFHLATSFRTAEGRLTERAEGVVKLITALAQSSASSAYWQTLASAVRLAFVERRPARDLIAYGNSQTDRLSTSLAYLGASLDPNAPLQTALRAHLAILPAAMPGFEAAVGTCRRILLPFLETFWRSAFQESRFRFSRPADIERDLEGAAEIPLNRRPQFILRTVARGLGVAIPEGARSWLAGAP